MKIGNETIAIKTTVPVVAVARGDARLVLECGAVTKEHWEHFDKVVPEPVMPNMLVKGKGEQPDPTSPHYLEAMDDYRTKRYHYTIIASLLYTKDLSFEVVDINKPDTWEKITDELAEAGILPPELTRIVTAVYEAQGISQDKVDEALEHFLMQKQAALTSSDGE